MSETTDPRPGRTRILNLGSGPKKMTGAVNVDVVDSTRPESVHDLNVRPWPLDTAAFDEIHAYDVLEHVHDVVAFMEEVHRVCAPEGVVHITVPHFSSGNAWRDPTHRRAFTHDTLLYFDSRHPRAFYSSARFETVHSEIIFAKTLINKLVSRLANRWPASYEDRWAGIFPAWYLYWKLRRVERT